MAAMTRGFPGDTCAAAVSPMLGLDECSSFQRNGDAQMTWMRQGMPEMHEKYQDLLILPHPQPGRAECPSSGISQLLTKQRPHRTQHGVLGSSSNLNADVASAQLHATRSKPCRPLPDHTSGRRCQRDCPLLAKKTHVSASTRPLGQPGVAPMAQTQAPSPLALKLQHALQTLEAQDAFKRQQRIGKQTQESMGWRWPTMIQPPVVRQTTPLAGMPDWMTSSLVTGQQASWVPQLLGPTTLPCIGTQLTTVTSHSRDHIQSQVGAPPGAPWHGDQRWQHGPHRDQLQGATAAPNNNTGCAAFQKFSQSVLQSQFFHRILDLNLPGDEGDATLEDRMSACGTGDDVSGRCTNTYTSTDVDASQECVSQLKGSETLGLVPAESGDRDCAETVRVGLPAQGKQGSVPCTDRDCPESSGQASTAERGASEDDLDEHCSGPCVPWKVVREGSSGERVYQGSMKRKAGSLGCLWEPVAVSRRRARQTLTLFH